MRQIGGGNKVAKFLADFTRDAIEECFVSLSMAAKQSNFARAENAWELGALLQ
jgi:hypothetical protein